MKKKLLITIILLSPIFIYTTPSDDLLQAARAGSVSGVQNALLAGASIDSLQYPDEKNVFMIASSAAVLDQLLSAPSFLKFHNKPTQCLGINNINRSDKNGKTALAYAIENNDLRKVKALVKHGVRLGEKLILTHPIRIGGNTYNAMYIDQFAGLMAMQRSGSTSTNPSDINPILNNDPIYQYLIQAHNGRKIKQEGYFTAINNNDLNAVKDALAPQGEANMYGGANVNGLTDEGYSHLVTAFQHGGHQTLFNFLLHDVYQFMCENNMVPQYTRVNIQSSNGKTTLQEAIEAGSVNGVKSLLTAQASLTNTYNNQTLPAFAQSTWPITTPVGAEIARSIANSYLFYLVQNGTVNAINNILEGSIFIISGTTYRCAIPAEINARNQIHGATPAMYAAVAGEIEKLRALIGKGADVSSAMRNDTGLNTLMQAALYGQTEAISIILDSGNYTVEDVNAINNVRQTALMLAAQYGSLPAIQALLNAGANKNLTDSNGNNALWYLDNGPYAAKMYKYEKNEEEGWQEVSPIEAANRRREIIQILTPTS